MQTFIEKQKNVLLRKFHALLGRAGVNANGKEAMLASYGVSTSKDLTVYELTELCGKLDQQINIDASESDRWRKRLIAAVGGYLTAMGKPCDNLLEIKAIACRAAQTDNFNRIPLERLKSLYNAFKNRENDLKEIDKITGELLMSVGISRSANKEV